MRQLYRKDFELLCITNILQISSKQMKYSALWYVTFVRPMNGYIQASIKKLITQDESPHSWIFTNIDSIQEGLDGNNNLFHNDAFLVPINHPDVKGKIVSYSGQGGEETIIL